MQMVRAVVQLWFLEYNHNFVIVVMCCVKVIYNNSINWYSWITNISKSTAHANDAVQ